MSTSPPHPNPLPKGEGNKRRGRLLGDFFGAFGDIGILIPIVVGLVVLKGLSCAALLFFVGLAYLVSGAWAKIPLSVQPLKAACIILIASALPKEVLFAAAIVLGLLFLFLGASGGVYKLSGLFPSWVICGIQLGLGLILIQSGARLAFFGLSTAPPAQPSMLSLGQFAFSLPPAWAFKEALIFLVPAQFALSVGNSVYAAADTARRYFGERAKRVNEKNLCFSLGLWNVAAGFLGLMPVCHGSVGITAHVKLGARTALCNFVIGGTLLAASLWPGLQSSVTHCPTWILGGLLVYVGVQHALLIRGRAFTPWELLGALSMGLVSVWSGHVLAGMVWGIVLVPMIRLRRHRTEECVGCS